MPEPRIPGGDYAKVFFADIREQIGSYHEKDPVDTATLNAELARRVLAGLGVCPFFLFCYLSSPSFIARVTALPFASLI
jgi:hypothetical protein